ncbi:MAG: flagellar export chaperone FliS [Candidatus Zixiibacteriota bacterium]
MISGHHAYQEISTLGMSQLDLILTVYRGTIELLNQAKKDFESNRLAEGRVACDKTRKCLVHLYTTLNMEKGGEIAEYLGKIYAHLIEQLDLAAANKSQKYFENIISHLTTIKEAWDELKESESQRINNYNPNLPDGNICQTKDAIDGDMPLKKQKGLVVSA